MNGRPRCNLLFTLALGFAFAGCARAPRDAARPPSAPAAPVVSAPEQVAPPEPAPCTGDGCGDADFDRDGIPDKDDKCPTQPETIDGINDEDGCPC